MGRRSGGFSVVEMVVTLAIIAILMAALLPTISRRVSDSGITALAESLEALRASIQRFKAHTGEYPGELSQLKVRPVNGNRLCGGTMGLAASNAWKGPYVASTMGDVGVGIPTGDWVIDDALVRIPASGADTGRLYMQMQGMKLEDANLLNNAVDGAASEIPPQSAGLDTAGVITWTSISAASTTTARYGLIIKGC